MASIEKRALAAAGAIFALGGFFALNTLEFPGLNVLTVHLYVMLLAGAMMFLPLMSKENDYEKLESKVRKMGADLKTLMRQNSGIDEEE